MAATAVMPTRRSAGWGSRNGHIVVAVFTVWWTLGLGNLVYALYVHQRVHMGWVQWGLVVLAVTFVVGLVYASSERFYLNGYVYRYTLEHNLFYAAFDGLLWLVVYLAIALPILGIRRLLRRRREGAPQGQA